jgi:hypothetical protein
MKNFTKKEINENLNFKKQVSINYDNWFNTVEIFVSYRITVITKKDYKNMIKLTNSEIDAITIDGIKYDFEYLCIEKKGENEDGTIFEVSFVNK